ncbi:MAG: hypothetical protein JKY14_08435 [Paraglaciecola sp.]|nr:hypothetical protein [Paraglaciecola sp.]
MLLRKILLLVVLYLSVISASLASAGAPQKDLEMANKKIEETSRSTALSGQDKPLLVDGKWDAGKKDLLDLSKQIFNAYGPGPNTIMLIFFGIAFFILRRKDPAPKRSEEVLSE